MLKTNRRTFLKATAVAGASTLVVSDLLAQESPNEKVQFGCVGIGGKGASDSNDANRFGVVVAYTELATTRSKTTAKCSIRWATKSTPSPSAPPTTCTPSSPRPV